MSVTDDDQIDFFRIDAVLFQITGQLLRRKKASRIKKNRLLSLNYLSVDKEKHQLFNLYHTKPSLF